MKEFQGGNGYGDRLELRLEPDAAAITMRILYERSTRNDVVARLLQREVEQDPLQERCVLIRLVSSSQKRHLTRCSLFSARCDYHTANRVNLRIGGPMLFDWQHRADYKLSDFYGAIPWPLARRAEQAREHAFLSALLFYAEFQ